MTRVLDYRSSHLAAGKGEEYDRRFVENPHRAMMWRFEQEILDGILTTRLSRTEIRHLDFACGTGRILAHFEQRSVRSVGVDLSASMLSVARQRIETAQIIEADITRDDVLSGERFNLITAFRFFPNAGVELRAEAMRALLAHLDPDGYLVFNNHLNSSSTMLRLARLVGQSRGLGMTTIEVDRMVEGAGLEIVEIHHLGILPSNDRYLFLPLSVVQRVERWAMRYRVFRRLSQNLIYVCRPKSSERVRDQMAASESR